jgi:hypothetical protein
MVVNLEHVEHFFPRMIDYVIYDFWKTIESRNGWQDGGPNVGGLQHKL